MLSLGNKIIAGSFKAGASWEVGDVGISAFGIDEALNKRRYLNGQVISQAQFVEFTAMLKSRVSVYPNLSTTEVNWQAEATNSKLGQCGKFVIDDVAGTIRLPKVVNINGLQDLTGLGGIKAESLPNITGAMTPNGAYTGLRGTTASGVFSILSSANGLMGESVSNANGFDFNASRSSSTYQDGAPVQQEAVQYPYFIQVTEGVETSVDVSREIELNNPFSLLDYKYSEYELSNASWLLSNGQYNSGAVYADVYDLLLQIYNGTVIKAGVSVKLSTEAYADTDFVLNTGDTTFRLPTVVKLASGKAVVGNGMTLGWTDGTDLKGTLSANGGYVSIYAGNGYGANVGVGTIGGQISDARQIGITTDPTKSGIETSANGLYLYFYVGETVQDANIIAAAGVLTDMTNIKNASNFSQTGLSTLSGLGMPSNRYIDLTLGASGSTYTAPANGWVVARTDGNGGFIYLINTTSFVEQGNDTPSANIPRAALLPVRKGDVFGFFYNATITTFRFIYAEGEN